MFSIPVPANHSYPLSWSAPESRAFKTDKTRFRASQWDMREECVSDPFVMVYLGHDMAQLADRGQEAERTAVITDTKRKMGCLTPQNKAYQ